LYNTTFWSLVQQGGQTTTEAHATLRGTFAKDKHEILHSQFGINYNNLDARFRKGSILFRQEVDQGEPKSLPSSNDRPNTTDPPTSPLPISHETVASHQDGTPSQMDENTTTHKTKSKGKKIKNAVQLKIELMHCDIIKDEFWDARPGLLKD